MKPLSETVQRKLKSSLLNQTVEADTNRCGDVIVTCFLRSEDDEVWKLVTALLLRPDLKMSPVITRVLPQTHKLDTGGPNERMQN